jgi:hypothetical protein
MFDNESLNGQFGTQITLCRLNLMHLTGTFDNNKVIGHDLKVSNEAVLVEANDSIEFTTIVTLWKDMKLDEVSKLEGLIFIYFLHSNKRLLKIHNQNRQK